MNLRVEISVSALPRQFTGFDFLPLGFPGRRSVASPQRSDWHPGCIRRFHSRVLILTGAPGVGAQQERGEIARLGLARFRNSRLSSL